MVVGRGRWSLVVVVGHRSWSLVVGRGRWSLSFVVGRWPFVGKHGNTTGIVWNGRRC